MSEHSPATTWLSASITTSAKNGTFASYRYYKLTRAVDSQVDIGGFFSGDKLGTPALWRNRPQDPWYLVAGVTTNITTRLDQRLPLQLPPQRLVLE